VLLKKTWLIKRRHPVVLFLELIIPVAFILLFCWIKTLVPDVYVPSGWSTTTNAVDPNTGAKNDSAGTSDPLFKSRSGLSTGLFNLPIETIIALESLYSQPEYFTSEVTMSGFLTGMALASSQQATNMDKLSESDRLTCTSKVSVGGFVDTNTSSPFAVPKECNGYLIPYKLALAPDTPYVRKYFFETVSQWYPRVDLFPGVLSIPSLEESVMWFKTADDVEKYVESTDEYGIDLDHPKILGAITFDEYPTNVEDIGQVPENIEYTIRLNATSSSSNLIGQVPKTQNTPASPLLDDNQQSIKTSSYQKFATNGFMTLQTLVNRFLNCVPEWTVSNQSTSGVCQAKNATALNSTLMNAAATEQLENDMMLAATLGLFDASISSLPNPVPPVSIDTLPLAAKEALIRPLRQAPQPILGSTVYATPINAYRSADFFDAVGVLMPLVFVLSYFLVKAKILTAFIQEKETKMREILKIMGVPTSAILGSWYVTYMIIGFVGTLAQAVAAGIGMFQVSNVFLLFLFFYGFFLNVIAMSFVVSTIFDKAKTGSFVGLVLFFMLYFVTYSVKDDTPMGSQTMACLVPQVALALGISTISNLEVANLGLGFSTLTTQFSNFQFLNALLMMYFDFIWISLLGIYLEQVIPKEFGTAKPWYFPFVSKAFLARKAAEKTAAAQSMANETVDDRAKVEEVSAELKSQETNHQAVRIEALRKVFPAARGASAKVAVNGLDLNMYQGQITCLLGHNGAGKTTTISMLTGMLAPTSGDAFVGDSSITTGMDEIRHSLGICPQHDVLYMDLTVVEHLRFFGQLKGLSGSELDDAIATKIAEVGLTEKQFMKPDELSGGMKRKLSVAIALIGDSKFVFLDEPTSGMDPYSRRSTWELLQNHRKGRVMVLTTHFMDEADLLGDRIAIMAKGQLQCVGSSMFLKNQYGAGYTLTMVKDTFETPTSDDNTVTTVEGRTLSSEEITDRVTSLVHEHVPDAQLLSDVGAEISFQLPYEDSHKFAEFFDEIEAKKTELGVLSYGISITTMEEVFIKVADAEHGDGVTSVDDIVRENSLRKQSSLSLREDRRTKSSQVDDVHHGYKQSEAIKDPVKLFFLHLKALLTKRYRYAFRDFKSLRYSIVFPILLMLLGFALLLVNPNLKNQPSVPISTSGFPAKSDTPVVVYCAPDVSGSSDWCVSALNSGSLYDGSASMKSIPESYFRNPPYSSASPTVFDVGYVAPYTINNSVANLSRSASLRMGEVMFELGYQKNTENGDSVSGLPLDVDNTLYGGVIGQSDSDSNMVGYNLIVNTTAMQSAPVFKQLADQSMYRYFASQAAGSPKSPSVKVNNFPLPLSAKTKALFSSFNSFSAVILIVIGFSFIPASIVAFIVKEKEFRHNSKHQQVVSGVNLWSFWLANFIWDYIMYLIPCAAALIMIQAFNFSVLTGRDCGNLCIDNAFLATISLFILYGLAMCPFVYTLSYIFKEHTNAQNTVLIINFVIGVILLLVSFALSMIDSTKDTNESLMFLWRFSPPYCLGNGLLQMTVQSISVGFSLSDNNKGAFSLDVSGYEMIYLIVHIFFWSAMTVGIDVILSYPSIRAFFNRRVPSNEVTAGKEEIADEDVDVKKEAMRVASGGAEDDLIVMKGLRKVYLTKKKGKKKSLEGALKGNKIAVRNMQLGLPKGECFGFLGINGAGKTTTMKMLTGDVLPTSGTGTLAGFDILNEQLKVRSQIGYCPQFDALFDLLSVREHLTLFARIKGVPPNRMESVIQAKMHQMNLEPFENKLAGTLSGGNKRKLSVAIALIGAPKILFLDEPSTGMDPVARRFMWEVLSEISTKSKESTIVLTTHSMEEAEALSNRIGIMVGGRLRCLGTAQHLKSRFGQGLMMEVKLKTPSDDAVLAVEQRIHSAVPSLGADTDTHVVSLTEQEVHAALQGVGKSNYIDYLTTWHATGWFIRDSLDRTGSVPLSDVSRWIIAEERYEKSEVAWQRSFGRVEVIERHNEFNRLKIYPHERDGKTSLASVFRVIESLKDELDILEYNVGQTTLEQIFNQFASEQDEEKGTARGMQRQQSKMNNVQGPEDNDLVQTQFVSSPGDDASNDVDYVESKV
jgi:ATP-binding cassette subfamily A (ABC1) protein 1